MARLQPTFALGPAEGLLLLGAIAIAMNDL
jgi:hypothetical protein